MPALRLASDGRVSPPLNPVRDGSEGAVLLNIEDRRSLYFENESRPLEYADQQPVNLAGVGADQDITDLFLDGLNGVADQVHLAALNVDMKQVDFPPASDDIAERDHRQGLMRIAHLALLRLVRAKDRLKAPIILPAHPFGEKGGASGGRGNAAHGPKLRDKPRRPLQWWGSSNKPPLERGCYLMQNERLVYPGLLVLLADEPDCIIPAGWHVVSKVNADGSFHCGGNTAVWPRRIIEIKAKTPRVGGIDERFA